jgi:hypothetical protein
MDYQILFISFVSFCFFLVLHTYIFKHIDHKKVLIWIVNSCVLGSIPTFVLSFLFPLFSPIYEYTYVIYVIVVCTVSFLLYSMLAIIYILGFFGLLESSLRIRILEEIARRGDRGMKREELFRIYNRNVIITKRLERFIETKDIDYRNGFYIMRPRFSYFNIHSYIFESIKHLYSGGVHE